MKSNRVLSVVMGVVLMVCSLFALIVSISNLSDASEASQLASLFGGDIAQEINVMIMGFVAFLIGALSGLLTGVLGIVFRKKPAKTKACTITGAITAFLSLIFTITMFVTPGAPTALIVLGIIMIAVSVIFILCEYRYRKGSRQYSRMRYVME